MMRALLSVVGSIFLLRGVVAGGVVLLLMAQRPADLAGALVALTAAGLTARLVTGAWTAAQAGAVPVNALLVGVAVSHLGGWSPALALLLVLGGILVAGVTLVLEADLGRLLGLPILSLPFVLVTWLIHLAAVAVGPLPPPVPGAGLVLTLPMDLPVWFSGFFASLGTLIFRHDVATGVVLTLLLTVHSRLLVAFALVGHLVGTLVRWTLGGDWALACTDATAFTGPLTAMLLGGVLLVPGPAALAAAVLAAATATLVDRAVVALFAGSGLTPLTLSSVLGVCLALRLTAFGRPDLRPSVIEATPEETLVVQRTQARRLGDGSWDIAVPVSGQWSVWQGFDGPWTHRGVLRHALDFVIRDEDGRTHANAGLELEDYHAWRKPVLAPVSGVVVAACDGIPDNPIGTVDSERNWGNHVILRDLRGIHVELSHFARGSLRVALGQWVERGTVLGLCGNSGFSAQPHVHLQVQAGACLGNPTLPFRLTAWRGEAGFHLVGVPEVDEVIEAVPADPGLARTWDLIPGAVWTFAGEYRGQSTTVRWTVARAVDGSLVIEGERGRLFVGLHAGCFRIWRHEGDDPWLRLFQRTLPSLPLCRLDGLTWDDHLPVGVVRGRWATAWYGFCGLLLPHYGPVPVRLTALTADRIRTTLPGLGCFDAHLDPREGLVALVSGDRRLTRQHSGTPS